MNTTGDWICRDYMGRKELEDLISRPSSPSKPVRYDLSQDSHHLMLLARKLRSGFRRAVVFPTVREQRLRCAHQRDLRWGVLQPLATTQIAEFDETSKREWPFLVRLLLLDHG